MPLFHYRDPSTGNWVPYNIISSDFKIGPKASAAMILEASSGQAYYHARSVAGQYAGLLLVDATTQKNRWLIGKSNTAEGGASAGSDLNIARYDDAGTYLGTPVSISRATGLVSVAGDPTALLGVATKQYVDNRYSKVGSAQAGDWNLITSPGLHPYLMVGSDPNGPGTADYFYVMVYAYGATGNVTQVAYPYNSAKIWVRYRYSSSWSAWWRPVSATGDTMTGDLLVSKASPQVRTIASSGDAVFVSASDSYAGMQIKTGAQVLRWYFTKDNGTSGNLILHRYDDTGAWLGQPIVVNRASGEVTFANPVTVPNATAGVHAMNRDTADGRYVDQAGDSMTGTLNTTGRFNADDRVQVNNGAGVVLHTPGQSVAAIGSFVYGGTYGVRFLAEWQGNSGPLAPLQVGGPIDGNSAPTVDWVRSYTGRILHFDVGVFAADTGYGPWWWGHGMGSTFRGASVVGTYDDGVHSIVGSFSNGPWDGTNVGVCGRNVSAANESAYMTVIGFS